jgi:hypothetical protein
MQKRILVSILVAVLVPITAMSAGRLGRFDFETTPCRGMMLSDIERVDHYLYFPQAEQAQTASRGVDAKVFEAQVRPAATGSEQLLYLRYRSVPTPSQVQTDAKRLYALAKDSGGRYEGSGCGSHLFPMEELG